MAETRDCIRKSATEGGRRSRPLPRSGQIIREWRPPDTGKPHTAARAFASGRTRIVLLVLPDWPLDFNLRRNIEEASLALDEAGYALITYTPHQTGQARPLWETLQPDLVMSMTPRSPGQVDSIRASGITRIIPDSNHPTAEEWAEEGPVLQIRHLLGLLK